LKTTMRNRKPRTAISPRVPRPASGSAAWCFVPVLLLALSVCAAFPIQARAQLHDPEAKRPHEKPYALIFGTVWGPDDRPVYGVKVNVRRANEKKIRWELHSDHNGEFAVRLPAGPQVYVVSADLKGFKSLPGKQLHSVQEAHVHIENDERSDIGLHLKY
jgi:hypothetical protein